MKANVITYICPPFNSLPFPSSSSSTLSQLEKLFVCLRRVKKGWDVAVDRAILKIMSWSLCILYFLTSKRLTGSARRPMSSLQDKARGKVMQLKQGGR